MPGTLTPIIGRAIELAAIHDVLASAATGRGQTVLISGAAGVGKSRLLDALEVETLRQGAAWSQGGCSDSELSPPLGPIVDAVRRLSGDDEAAVARIVRLADRLLDGGSEEQAFGPERLLPILDAIIDWIDEQTRHRPLVLALDDVQWADETTLRCLAALANRSATIPLVIVLAHRPLGGVVLLEGLRERISSGSEPGLLLDLSDLDAASAIDIARTLLSAEPNDSLTELLAGAGGNPLFIVELLRNLREEGRLTITGTVAGVAGLEFPPSMDRLVAARLASLDADQQAILRLASILGTEFRPRDLAVLSDRSVASLLIPITAIDQAGWISDHGSMMRFSHDLVREAIYRTIPEPIRHALHREAAAVLDLPGRSALPAATHYAVSAERGDAGALDCLHRAARELAIANPPVAIRYLKQAIGLMDDHDETRRVRLTADLSRAHLWAGDIDSAGAIVRLELSRSSADELANESIVELEDSYAEALFLHGRLDEAAEYFERLGRLDNRRNASLRMADLGLCHVLNGRVAEAAAVAEKAVVQATRDAFSRGACEAHGVLALQFSLTGDHLMALHHAEVAVALADESVNLVGHRDLPLLFLSQVHSFADRSTESLAAIDRGLVVARSLRMTWDQPLFSATRATELMMAGSWDDAVAESESVLSYARDLGVRLFEPYAHAVLAHVARRRGDLDRAAQFVASGQRAVQQGATQGADLVLFEQVMVLAAQGDTGEAGDLGALLWSGLTSLDVAIRQRHFGPHLHHMARREGLEGLAERIHADACALIKDDALPGVVAAAMVIDGRHRSEPAPLRDAVAILDGLPRPGERADALAALAVIEAERQTPRAEMAVRAALEGYRALGASSDAEALADRVEAAGMVVRKRRRTARGFGWDSLTPSEQRVVAGVAQGQTNQAVAETLGVSRRTVESHLHHVYTKLDVDSRVQLATEAIARGIASVDPA